MTNRTKQILTTETVSMNVNVTSTPQGSGQALGYTQPTSKATIFNTSKLGAIEYQLNNGPWVSVPKNTGPTVDCDLSSDVIKLRQVIVGDGETSVEVSMETIPYPNFVVLPYEYPGMGPIFNRAVNGMHLDEDFVFGSAAIANANPVSKALKTLADVSTYFSALEGSNYDPVNGTVTNGTGLTTINSEIQRYRKVLDGHNHIMDSDGLRLQATMEAGSWNTIVRGQVLTTGGGLTINAPGATVVTAIADVGLVAGDLANIPVGTVCTGVPSGLMYVIAKDTTNNTITFENISAGAVAATKANYQVTFTSMSFNRVTQPITNGTTTTAVLSTPASPKVVVGMFAMGCTGGNPGASDRAKISAISGDRLTITFDSPLSFDQRNIGPANVNSGILFVPALESAQIWSKKGYGPQRAGKRVQAIEVEVLLPTQNAYVSPNLPNGVFNKTQVEAIFNLPANANVLWGYWPAVWLFTFLENGVVPPSPRNSYCEVDIWEEFNHINRGPGIWTGNLHDQPFTRRVSLTNDTKGINGAWLTSAADAKNVTPNVQYLGLVASANQAVPTGGTPVKFGLMMERDRLVHYFNGMPVCDSAFSVDCDYLFQLGINVACGALTNSFAQNIFFPQNDAQATGQNLVVRSIRTWSA